MPLSSTSTARASSLTGKPAANCALYAASCSLVVLIPHYLRCGPALHPDCALRPGRSLCAARRYPCACHRRLSFAQGGELQGPSPGGDDDGDLAAKAEPGF